MSASACPTAGRTRRASTAAILSLAVFAGTAVGTQAARADDLIVKYDQSQILRMPRPVAHIIIGNPTIADVQVDSGNMLIITGKTFGITNIIALDAERNIIQDQRIVVRRDDAKIVYLQKAEKRQSYNCTPNCNPSLVIGDETVFFETVAKTAERKIKFSEGNADGGGSSGGASQ